MKNKKEINAGIIIIGNEVLSGRTKDINTSTLSLWLNSLGVQVKEVRIIPDIEKVIIETINTFRNKFSYIFIQFLTFPCFFIHFHIFSCISNTFYTFSYIFVHFRDFQYNFIHFHRFSYMFYPMIRSHRYSFFNPGDALIDFH